MAKEQPSWQFLSAGIICMQVWLVWQADVTKKSKALYKAIKKGRENKDRLK